MTHRFGGACAAIHAAIDTNIAGLPEARTVASFAKCIVDRPECSLPVQYLWRRLFGAGGGTPT